MLAMLCGHFHDTSQPWFTYVFSSSKQLAWHGHVKSKVKFAHEKSTEISIMLAREKSTEISIPLANEK